MESINNSLKFHLEEDVPRWHNKNRVLGWKSRNQVLEWTNTFENQRRTFIVGFRGDMNEIRVHRKHMKFSVSMELSFDHRLRSSNHVLQLRFEVFVLVLCGGFREKKMKTRDS